MKKKKVILALLLVLLVCSLVACDMFKWPDPPEDNPKPDPPDDNPGKPDDPIGDKYSLEGTWRILILDDEDQALFKPSFDIPDFDLRDMEVYLNFSDNIFSVLAILEQFGQRFKLLITEMPYMDLLEGQSVTIITTTGHSGEVEYEIVQEGWSLVLKIDLPEMEDNPLDMDKIKAIKVGDDALGSKKQWHPKPELCSPNKSGQTIVGTWRLARQEIFSLDKDMASDDPDWVYIYPEPLADNVIAHTYYTLRQTATKKWLGTLEKHLSLLGFGDGRVYYAPHGWETEYEIVGTELREKDGSLLANWKIEPYGTTLTLTGQELRGEEGREEIRQFKRVYLKVEERAIDDFKPWNPLAKK